MLTKEDIIAHLEALDLDPSRYWVTAGAALLFYGLRETTADIDLGCDRILADQLEARGYDARREADGRRRFHLPGACLLYTSVPPARKSGFPPHIYQKSPAWNPVPFQSSSF